MITRVYPPPGILGLGRYRTVGVIARPISAGDANAIAVALAQAGIQITVSVDKHRVVHLWPWPGWPLTNAQEITALRAFIAVTDCRIAWHPAVTHA